MPSVRKPMSERLADALAPRRDGGRARRTVSWMRRERRARELELAAGLERDRAAAAGVVEADDVVAASRIGSQPVSADKPVEQRPDAALALVGHRRMVSSDRTGTSRARCRGATLRAASRLRRSRLRARRARRWVSHRKRRGPCATSSMRRADLQGAPGSGLHMAPLAAAQCVPPPGRGALLRR